MDSAPHYQQGTFRLIDEAGRLVKELLAGGPARLGLVAARAVFEIEGLCLHVLGQIDQHGARSALLSDLKCLFDDWADVLRLHHQVRLLHHWSGHADRVALLEGLGAHEGTRDLSGDGDDGRRVHLRGGQASHQVCRARSGRCDADSDTSRQTRVGLGRVGRRLLVPHQYVPQLRVVPERVVEGQDCPAGVAENNRDAFPEEGFANRVGADRAHDVLSYRGRCLMVSKNKPVHWGNGLWGWPGLT